MDQISTSTPQLSQKQSSRIRQQHVASACAPSKRVLNFIRQYARVCHVEGRYSIVLN